jgi:diaminopimelate epimerase
MQSMKINTLKFSKYSGNGNDFVILDRPATQVTPELVQRLCSRHFGVGADGVLTLIEREGHDGEMHIFNSDGSEAEMCGNGLRCLATYIDDTSSRKKDLYTIKTMNGSYTVVRKNGAFAIEMSELKDKNIHDLTAFKDFKSAFFINTGVPHLVFLGEGIKTIDIKRVAPQFRFHPMFPGGTNVSLVEITGENSAYVRTYERGVEDETHSCGTGLTATGIALSNWFGWKGTIKLNTKGGEQRVEIGDKVLYSGEVFRCFSGEFAL